MTDKPGRPVRLRATSDKKKALAAYDEMRRGGRVARALVIVESHSGHIDVLGQGLKMEDIAELLLVSMQTVAHLDEQRKELRPEPHQAPISVGAKAGPARKEREITTAPDGTMQPPPGETIISCGECQHPRWYVLLREADNNPARFACAHCGNEVKQIPVFHAEGRA